MEQNKAKTEATTAPAPAAASAAPAVEEKKTVLELLEEDDEFEEFEGATWENQAANVTEDTQLWQDNWEDDDNQDDFTNQLRAHLEAKASSGQQ